MRQIRIDTEELRESAKRLASHGRAFTPVAPRSAIGGGAFGFPALESAVSRLAASIDAELGDLSHEATGLSRGLEAASARFVEFEDHAASVVNGLAREL